MEGNNYGIPEIMHSTIVLEQKIGKGAFGIVYKGKWKGRLCAVKKLQLQKFNIETIGSGTDYRVNVAEAAIQLKLKHPNIVQIFGISYAASYWGDYWIIMQYVNGKSLEAHIHWLANRKNECIPPHLSFKERIRIARQACDALSYMHKQGYVHGDVSPQNLILEERTNRLYFCDFGTAQFIGNNKHGCNYSVQNVAFTFAGTLAYLSPECFKEDETGSHRITTKSDIWSLGLVLLEFFSESLVFSSQKEIMDFKLRNKLDIFKLPLSKIKNESIVDIIKRATNHDCFNRPSASELYEEFLVLSK